PIRSFLGVAGRRPKMSLMISQGRRTLPPLTQKTQGETYPTPPEEYFRPACISPLSAGSTEQQYCCLETELARRSSLYALPEMPATAGLRLRFCRLLLHPARIQKWCDSARGSTGRSPAGPPDETCGLLAT